MRNAMKAEANHRAGTAFTLLELLVVIGIILIVAGLLLPALRHVGAKGRQVACLGHLKQLGAASHLFANDHGDEFPAQVSTNQGGSREYNLSAPKVAGVFAFTFRNFQVLSNELSTPQVLVCRADRRPAASNFFTLTDRHVSYFTGLDAAPARPRSALAGDGNVTNVLAAKAKATVALGDLEFGWTRALHGHRGNVVFADGHVELLRSFAMSRTVDLPSAEPGPGRTTGGGSSSSAARFGSSGSRDRGLSAATGSSRFDTGTGGQTRSRETRTKPGPDAGAPDGSAAGFSSPAATAPEPREEWDTDRFRFFAFLFKLALLAYLIAGVILLVVYVLKRRKELEAGLGWRGSRTNLNAQ